MAGEYSHEHPVTIHEGPMADKRGTDWRDDARKLEELNQQLIENPNKSLPNSLTSMDKEHPEGSKGDTGRVYDGDNVRRNEK